MCQIINTQSCISQPGTSEGVGQGAPRWRRQQWITGRHLLHASALLPQKRLEHDQQRPSTAPNATDLDPRLLPSAAPTLYPLLPPFSGPSNPPCPTPSSTHRVWRGSSADPSPTLQSLNLPIALNSPGSYRPPRGGRSADGTVCVPRRAGRRRGQRQQVTLSTTCPFSEASSSLKTLNQWRLEKTNTSLRFCETSAVNPLPLSCPCYETPLVDNESDQLYHLRFSTSVRP